MGRSWRAGRVPVLELAIGRAAFECGAGDEWPVRAVYNCKP